MNSTSIDIKYNETLSSRLEHLVGNKLGSDLSFIIEDTDETIPAHKIIVALSSPVLNRIIYGNETFPPSDIIKVDGICKESFMQIIRYIYTDRIDLDEDNVFDILLKSNYFGLVGVETKCLEYLEENLSIVTVPWIYHQLFFSGSSQLLDKCLQYIRIQPLKFFTSELFESVSIDELKSIIELDAINCTEVDLFEAMVRLSRAHCAAVDLETTPKNQRKILDGTEKLLRLESLTESEFDKCLAIQKDFYSTEEIDRIRACIRSGVAPAKRKWYTYQDAVWIEMTSDVGPPSVFITDSHRNFIHRCCNEDKEPLVIGIDNYFQLNQSDVQILCGSGYEWQECKNGKIPLGSVPVSLDYPEPLFIARGPYRHYSLVGHVAMNGTMKMLLPHGESVHVQLSEFEILVAKNVKNPYTGNGVPSDAIFVGYSENNHKTYLGRAWFRNDLLPAKVIFSQQADPSVPYGGGEHQVDEFDFVRMDVGTYNWEADKNGEVPENAVIGGYTDGGEVLYFGRVMHHGNYIPGKVHPSHGVLYVPFRDEEINFRSYEVLVHVNNS